MGLAVKTPTHYDTLGIARNAPAEVIRAAYKALAQKNHPDKNYGNPDANNLMQVINLAYDVLSDPQKRAEYDAMLSRQEALVIVPAAAQQQGHPQSSGGANPAYPPPRQPKQGSQAPFLLTVLAGALSFIFFNYINIPLHKPPLIAPTPPAQVKAPSAPKPKTTTPQELAACIFKSAKTYDVPPAALLGILSEEGGAVGEKSRVIGNTYDLGLMQINSSWVPRFAKDWGVNEDMALRMVQDDACINVNAGAWILHAALQQNADISKAIVAYHAAVHHVDERATDGEYVRGVLKLMDVYKSIHSPEDLVGQTAAPSPPATPVAR